MASRKIELVLEREEYTDSMDNATVVIRFYNDKETPPIRTATDRVPKDHGDEEVARHLLRVLLG